ncbi:MAG: hypothetical protein LKM39_09410 [Chiayiivirga sp.]|nr:hypothetical protein [Chiayiivirga sp.]
MTQPDYPVLMLKRGEDRRLRAGHLWVFSNEVDVARTPLDRFQPGDPVRIVRCGRQGRSAAATSTRPP